MKLTLIRGLPGSGKTTKAKELQDNRTVICEADSFFEMEDGTYNFDPTCLHYAHMMCQSRVAYFLFRGINVIVSNTSIHTRDIKTYWLLAEKFGADFEIINCVGNYGNIHNVPPETLEKMSLAFEVIATEGWLKFINRERKLGVL